MAHWHRTSNVCYPAPEATHEQVSSDIGLFNRTLDNLLNHIGIKLKIPKVGGVEVDLHLLYKEVTTLGGLELVINRKQWVIVCEPFNFPPSFTNKSFVIKKLYLNALHHYEQLYFHRRQGPLVPPPAGPAGETPTDPRFTNSPLKRRSEYDAPMTPGPVSSQSGFMQPVAVVPAGNSSGSPCVPSDLKDGTRFSGSIDGGFEHGYMITLNLPGQRLSAVLYKQAPANLLPPHMARLRMGNGNDNSNRQDLDGGMPSPGKRPRPAGPPVPPLQIRPARTPFQFFQLGVNKDQLLQLHPNPTSQSTKELLPKLISDLWHQMTEEQRQPFLDMASRDKERYEKDWNEYNRRFGQVAVEKEEDQELTPGPVRTGIPITPGSRRPPMPLPPSFSHQLHLSHPSSPPVMSPSGQGHQPGMPARLAKSASMPPPMLDMSPLAKNGKTLAHELASAPGFQLLPPDMEPEELDHLCHYNEDIKPHAFQFEHAADGARNSQGGNEEAQRDGLDGAHGLSAADFNEQNDQAFTMAILNGHDADAFALEVLHGHDAEAAANAAIDLFGCSTLVQVNTTGPAAKVDNSMGMPACATGAPLGKSSQQRVTGQEGDSGAGSPSDDHVSQGFHGMPMPPGPSYTAMYNSPHSPYKYDAADGLLDDCDQPLAQVFH